MIKRGQIYWCDFGPPIDERQAGRRPVLIVQTDFLNTIPAYGLTIVVPITTKGRPSHIQVSPSSRNGLLETSYIKFEQMFTVAKRNLGAFIGDLDEDDLALVKEKLAQTLSLEN